MRIEYEGPTSGHWQGQAAEVLVGRTKGNAPVDVSLDKDLRVSRRHAVIRPSGDGFEVIDQGSTHGTTVNDRPAPAEQPVFAPLGAVLKVGDTELRLLPDGEGTPPPTSQSLPLPRSVVTVYCLPRLNYAVAHSDRPWLYLISIQSDDPAALAGRPFELSVSGLATLAPLPLPEAPAGEDVLLTEFPRLRLEYSALEDVTEERRVSVRARIDGRPVPVADPAHLTVLPRQAWDPLGPRDVLACFVAPNCDAVRGIMDRARGLLTGLLPGAVGFIDVLHSDNPAAPERALEVIHEALRRRKRRIAYEGEPPSPERWQRIRLHHEVMAGRAGTCIDLAVLLAACLESVHLRPVLILVTTEQDDDGRPLVQHALVGCWRPGAERPCGVLLDEADVRAAVEQRELIVLESLGYAATRHSPEGMSFEDCAQTAAATLKASQFAWALDVRAARDRGVMSLPLGTGLLLDRCAAHALHRARVEAEQLGSSEVGARHLLVALLRHATGPLPRVLERLKAGSAQALLDATVERLSRGRSPRSRGDSAAAPLPHSRGLEAVLAEVRQRLRPGVAACEVQLSLGLLRAAERVRAQFARAGVEAKSVLEELESLLPRESVSSDWSGSGSASIA